MEVDERAVRIQGSDEMVFRDVEDIFVSPVCDLFAVAWLVRDRDDEGFVLIDGCLDFSRKFLIHLSCQDDDDGDMAFQEELQHILFELRLKTADDAGILGHARSPVEAPEDVLACGLAGAEEGYLLLFQQVYVSDMG